MVNEFEVELGVLTSSVQQSDSVVFGVEQLLLNIVHASVPYSSCVVSDVNVMVNGAAVKLVEPTDPLPVPEKIYSIGVAAQIPAASSPNSHNLLKIKDRTSYRLL